MRRFDETFDCLRGALAVSEEIGDTDRARGYWAESLARLEQLGHPSVADLRAKLSGLLDR